MAENRWGRFWYTGDILDLMKTDYAYASAILANLSDDLLDEKTVVILDEANMLGASKYAELMQEVRASGAKVISIQDPYQISSLERGDIARGMIDRIRDKGENVHEIKSVIIRQKSEWMRQASILFNEHRTVDGLKMYWEDEQGNRRMRPNMDGVGFSAMPHIEGANSVSEAIEKIVGAYVADYEYNLNNPEQAKSQLMLASTHEAVSLLKEETKQALQAKGLIEKEDKQIEIDGKHYSFAIGERVLFTKNDHKGSYVRNCTGDVNSSGLHGVKNGTFGNILDIQGSEVTVKLSDRVVEFDLKEYDYITSGYAVTINKSEGMTVDIRYNYGDRVNSADKELVSNTRHKYDSYTVFLKPVFGDYKGYINSVRVAHSDNVADYEDYGGNKQAETNVKHFMEVREKVAEIVNIISISQIDEDKFSSNPDQEQAMNERAKQVEKLEEQYKYLKEFKGELTSLASIISSDWQAHRLYAGRNNLKQESIELLAGTRKDLVGELEHEIREEVKEYMGDVRNLRSLREEISKTHPAGLMSLHEDYKQYEALKHKIEDKAQQMVDVNLLYKLHFVRLETKEIKGKDGEIATQVYDSFGVNVTDYTARISWKYVEKQAEQYKLNLIKKDYLSKFGVSEIKDVQDYLSSKAIIGSIVDRYKVDGKIKWDQLNSSEHGKLYKQSIGKRDQLALSIFHDVEKRGQILFALTSMDKGAKLVKGRGLGEKEFNAFAESVAENAKVVDSLLKEAGRSEEKEINSNELDQRLKANIATLAIEVWGLPKKPPLKEDTKMRIGNNNSKEVFLKEGKYSDYEAGERRQDVWTLFDKYIEQKGLDSLDKKTTALKWLGTLSYENDTSNLWNQAQASEYNKKHTQESIQKMEELYFNSKPLKNTIGERYLKEQRKITVIPETLSLRFIDDKKGARLLAFTTNKEGDRVGVQQIYLDRREAFKLEHIGGKGKINTGQMKEAFTLLKQDNKNNTIYIAEGLETGLSIVSAGVHGSVIVTHGIANMENVEVEKGDKVVICADNDSDKFKQGKSVASLKQLEDVTKSFYKQGADISVIRPNIAGQDFNDVLKDKGVGGVQEYLDIVTDINERSVALPQLSQDPDQALEDLVNVRHFRKGLRSEDFDRLRYELSVIKEMGFSNYFLMVTDIVDYAKDKDIDMGYGKGSAVGSLVAYVLGITKVNPVEHDLSFERFLNKNRQEMPDIDLDIQASRKGEVLNYLKGKYGFNRVAHLGEIDKNGQHKAHQCGVAILSSDIQKLDNVVYNRKTDMLVMGSDYRDAEKRGIVKFDLLSSANLDVKEKTILYAKQKSGEEEGVALDEQGFAFKCLSNNDTRGVFQCSSKHAQNILHKVKPTNKEELANTLALIRRPMEDGKYSIDYVNEYVRGVERRSEVLADILKDTKGVLLYQEQVMEIGQKIGKFSPEESDDMRRSMKGKNKEDINQFREEFIKNAIGLFGIGGELKKQEAEGLWDEMSRFSKFADNKSHVVAYADQAVDSAILKMDYPFEFARASYESAIAHNAKSETKEMTREVLKQAKLAELKTELTRYEKSPEIQQRIREHYRQVEQGQSLDTVFFATKEDLTERLVRSQKDEHFGKTVHSRYFAESVTAILENKNSNQELKFDELDHVINVTGYAKDRATGKLGTFRQYDRINLDEINKAYRVVDMESRLLMEGKSVAEAQTSASTMYNDHTNSIDKYMNEFKSEFGLDNLEQGQLQVTTNCILQMQEKLGEEPNQGQIKEIVEFSTKLEEVSTVLKQGELIKLEDMLDRDLTKEELEKLDDKMTWFENSMISEFIKDKDLTLDDIEILANEKLKEFEREMPDQAKNIVEPQLDHGPAGPSI